MHQNNPIFCARSVSRMCESLKVRKSRYFKGILVVFSNFHRCYTAQMDLSDHWTAEICIVGYSATSVKNTTNNNTRMKSFRTPKTCTNIRKKLFILRWYVWDLRTLDTCSKPSTDVCRRVLWLFLGINHTWVFFKRIYVWYSDRWPGFVSKSTKTIPEGVIFLNFLWFLLAAS